MEFMRKLAEGCMPFLEFLESIRNPVLDFFFSLITHLGEETFFLAIAILFFWCIDKKHGYFILITGLVGTVFNQVAKLFFRVPRPWILDPKFEIIEAAREEATGYSFPSGHTQNIAGTCGTIAAHKHNKVKTIICVVIIALVAFSRMYLGVHTPIDVLVSLLFALAIILCIKPCFDSDELFKKSMPWIVVFSAILSACFLGYVVMIGSDPFLDGANYNSGLKNACTLIGCMVGLVFVYIIDTKHTNFRTDARWYAQIIKLVIGLCGVLVIKSGLSAPLTALFGNEYPARAVRYFLIVIFSGVVWPLTFNWFSQLKIDFMERFTDWVNYKVLKKPEPQKETKKAKKKKKKKSK